MSSVLADTQSNQEIGEPDETRTARFAIDVRGMSFHAESDNLLDFLGFLDGVSGRAHVFDREKQMLMFDGSAQDLHRALYQWDKHRAKGERHVESE